jgi:hypothetical protein
MAANPLPILKTGLQGYSERDLSLISVGHLATVPLLFHTGYLTIDKIVKVDGKDQYFFKVPNFELKDSYYNILQECLYIKNSVTEASELNQALRERDSELLTDIINVLFNRIPYDHYKKNEYLKESFFHMALLCYCSGLLSDTRAEEVGSKGKSDLILITAGGPPAFMEIKYAKSPGRTGLAKTLDKLVEQAFRAIKEKKYGERYKLPGQDIVPIGLGVIGQGEVKAVFGDPAKSTV